MKTITIYLSRTLPAVLLSLAFALAALTPALGAGLSIEEEKKIGREIYEKLEKAHAISKKQRVTE